MHRIAERAPEDCESRRRAREKHAKGVREACGPISCEKSSAKADTFIVLKRQYHATSSVPL